jgi:hypothetical protein
MTERDGGAPAPDSIPLSDLYTADDRSRIKDLMYHKVDRAQLHEPDGMRTWVAEGDTPDAPIILTATPYFADILQQRTFVAGMAEMTGNTVVSYDYEEYFMGQDDFLGYISPVKPVLWPRSILRGVNAARERLGRYPTGTPRSMRRDDFNPPAEPGLGEYEAMGEWKGLWPLVDKAMHSLIDADIIDHPDDPNKRPVIPVGHSKAGLLSMYHAVWLAEHGYKVPHVVAGEIASMRDASIAEGLPKYFAETLQKPYDPVAALEAERAPVDIAQGDKLNFKPRLRKALREITTNPGELSFKPQLRRIGSGILDIADKENLTAFTRRLAFTAAFARELAPPLMMRFIQATGGDSKLTIFSGEDSTISEADEVRRAIDGVSDFYGCEATAGITWLRIENAAHNVTDSQDFFANLCLKSLAGDYAGNGPGPRTITVTH